MITFLQIIGILILLYIFGAWRNSVAAFRAVGPYISAIDQEIAVAMIDKQPDLASTMFALKRTDLERLLTLMYEKAQKHNFTCWTIVGVLNAHSRHKNIRWKTIDERRICVTTKHGSLQWVF